MAEKTAIAWCDHTFNSWLGCCKVSAGCDNCYAETLTKNRMGLSVWGKDADRQQTGKATWRKPLEWNAAAATARERRRVFCGSLMDWAEAHPVADRVRPALFALIKQTPWLDWLLLTKRPGRIPRLLPDDWGSGWPNVWLGTSIENEDVAYRADHLRRVSAEIRFISYEPALGPLDSIDLTGIHWLIFGGESGPGYRPMDIKWARDIRRRCDASGTAFFYKQSAAPRTEMGIKLDGEIVRNWPLDRQPRGFELHAAPTTAPVQPTLFGL